MPGKYSPNEGYASCLDCPSGYFCLNQTSNFTLNVCPPGYYCPNGTKEPHEYPCPPGTYNPNVLAQSNASCIPCTPGFYCDGYANVQVTNTCSEGYYCPGSNWNSTPAATFCQKRHYCPSGSAKMTVCTAGSFCTEQGLSKPMGKCSAGYYCPNGSLVPTEIECTPGSYCNEGASFPIACPAGTFFNVKRAYSFETSCSNCTQGSYCETSGLFAPSGLCGDGYYCPPGQSVKYPNDFICPKGHYCETGFALPRRCENGTYQDNKQGTSCKDCDPGYFCDNTDNPVTSLVNQLCPIGYFCPSGTRYSNEFGCLPGTWSNRTHLNDSSQCDACPPK